MPVQQIPLINGRRHSWGDVSVNVLGRTVTGITAISYKKKRNKTNNYGSGSEPDHRGRGNSEYEASITLYDYEVDAIVNTLAEGQDLTDIAPFSIPVVYDTGNGQIKTDVLQNVEFLEDARDLKQGDTKIERVCPLIIAGIK
jgi:hypothetical protein